MARYYQVMSADGHVETPPESWVRYVPQKHQRRAPRLTSRFIGLDLSAPITQTP